MYLINQYRKPYARSNRTYSCRIKETHRKSHCQAVKRAAGGKKGNCRSPSQQQHLLHCGGNNRIETQDELLGMRRRYAQGYVCGNGNGARHRTYASRRARRPRRSPGNMGDRKGTTGARRETFQLVLPHDTLRCLSKRRECPGSGRECRRSFRP